MKILLDECTPRKLKDALTDHECQTVPEAGLAGKKNGDLLSLAERAAFDVFFTMDKVSSTSRVSSAGALRFSLSAPSQTVSRIFCRT